MKKREESHSAFTVSQTFPVVYSLNCKTHQSAAVNGTKINKASFGLCSCNLLQREIKVKEVRMKEECISEINIKWD